MVFYSFSKTIIIAPYTNFTITSDTLSEVLLSWSSFPMHANIVSQQERAAMSFNPSDCCSRTRTRSILVI